MITGTTWNLLNEINGEVRSTKKVNVNGKEVLNTLQKMWGNCWVRWDCFIVS